MAPAPWNHCVSDGTVAKGRRVYLGASRERPAFPRAPSTPREPTEAPTGGQGHGPSNSPDPSRATGPASDPEGRGRAASLYSVRGGRPEGLSGPPREGHAAFETGERAGTRRAPVRPAWRSRRPRHYPTTRLGRSNRRGALPSGGRAG